jgi:cellulose synthase/poly-beta-1,6-N-acetylglucosamine synthase-like glycosyltransferase
MASLAGLSLIIPVHNEQDHLVAALDTLFACLDSLRPQILSDFEVLLVDNGSTDATPAIAQSQIAARPSLNVLRLESRGLGGAIRAGIRQAKFDVAMFYSIDLPFGVNVVRESLAALTPQTGMVIGSKGHPDSRITRSATRRLPSAILQTLLRLLFGIRLSDTQGSQLFRTAPVRCRLDRMDSPGAFFQVQLVLAVQRAGLGIVEIPVHLADGRPSRMNIVTDGWNAFTDLVRERFRRDGV